MCRRQFDLAHREAMDESAEWRSRFDEERARASQCMKELTEVCHDPYFFHDVQAT